MQIVKEPRGQEKKRETVSRFWIGGESLQPDDKGRMPKRARLIVRRWGAQIHDPTLENCANLVLAKFYFKHSTSWVSVDRRTLIECAILWPQRAECSVSVLTLLTPAPSNRRGGRKQDAPVAKMIELNPMAKESWMGWPIVWVETPFLIVMKCVKVCMKYVVWEKQKCQDRKELIQLMCAGWMMERDVLNSEWKNQRMKVVISSDENEM